MGVKQLNTNIFTSSASGNTTISCSVGGFYKRFGKRVFDILMAIVMLPSLLPVIAVLWLLTVRDGGAGFFGHVRVGKDGKRFRCWKVRTMVVDAEEKLQDYLAQNPEAAAEWERDFKLENDPRITKLGKFLRRTSLDELPQIWNVLKGEMTFVGPRPIVEKELERYGNRVGHYLAITPGITGLWQVSGRNDVSYETRVAMDVNYRKLCSFGLDLMIILKTGGSVIFSTGK